MKWKGLVFKKYDAFGAHHTLNRGPIFGQLALDGVMAHEHNNQIGTLGNFGDGRTTQLWHQWIMVRHVVAVLFEKFDDFPCRSFALVFAVLFVGGAQSDNAWVRSEERRVGKE